VKGAYSIEGHRILEGKKNQKEFLLPGIKKKSHLLKFRNKKSASIAVTIPMVGRRQKDQI